MNKIACLSQCLQRKFFIKLITNLSFVQMSANDLYNLKKLLTCINLLELFDTIFLNRVKLMQGGLLMKKFFIALCAFALLLPTALGLVACDSGTGGGSNNTTATQKARNVYAYSAVVGATFFSSLPTTSVLNTCALMTTETSELSSDVKNELAAGLKMFDELLESGDISITIGRRPNEETDYIAYNFKMTVTIPNSEHTFTIYFSEYKKEEGGYSNSAISNPNEEIEYSTKLSGVVVYGDDTYSVEGKREYEQGEGETESEIEFKIYKDDSNYVKLSQGTETGLNKSETEYELEAVLQGNTIFKCEIEFEVENGQLELEFEIEQATGVTVSEREYKIKPGATSGTYIITYEDETNNSKVTINATKNTNGSYTFVVSNSTTA